MTTALSWPPARHRMSAMASARQWVLWALEGCSCLRRKKDCVYVNGTETRGSSATQRGALEIGGASFDKDQGKYLEGGALGGAGGGAKRLGLAGPGVCVKGGETWQPRRPSRRAPALLPPMEEEPSRTQARHCPVPAMLGDTWVPEAIGNETTGAGGAGEQSDPLVTRSRRARGYGRGRIRDEEHEVGGAGSGLSEVVYVPWEHI